MTMAATIAAGLLVGWLPGAALYRLPILNRDARAALAFEERLFWQVLLSVAWSVAAALALAAVSMYSLPRLAAVNAGLVVLSLVTARGRLRWRGTAARPTAAALLPVLLLVLGYWRFFPSAEYVLGGKDPGVYVNEGLNIQRTGSIFRRDAVVTTVPEDARELFFPRHPSDEYFSVRFMGVFLTDPATGDVMPGFPHLLPASIAIGAALAGVRGATHTVGVWALLGLLAVYFLGARLVGRGPAFLACVLLALNVVEVWYGRYPNAEVVMQALLFAMLLALARATDDGQRWFGWVAGACAALLIFLRFDAYLAIAGAAAALALVWIVQGRHPGAGFFVVTAAASTLAHVYYNGPLQAYFFQYRINLPPVSTGLAVAAAAVAATLALGAARRRIGPWLTRYVPPFYSAALVALAIYALFFREPGGRLADYDAYALRTLRDAYVYWPALLAALAGLVLVPRRVFWRDPAFFVVLAAFALFFLNRIRIVPEHFWMARRFIPVILPGMLLLAAGAAVGLSSFGERRALGRRFAGLALVGFMGWQYAVTAAPVVAHVEYAGAIRHVETLAGYVGERDLVLVESRNAQSDMHVFAVPLAYQYGRQVLVLDSPRPDRRMFEAFLVGAAKRYDRILFVGGAGTDLLSRRITADPVAFVPVMLPEYATTAWNDFPSGPRRKDLGYSVYELRLADAGRRGFSLDVGYLDDLHVLRFHAREITEGRTFRWTGPQSFIAVTGLTGRERELVLVMDDGGRPAGMDAAVVDVSFNGTELGRIRVGRGFQEYRLALPVEAVRAAAASDVPAEIRLVSSTWRPSETLGGSDDRALGVMIDRVDIH